LADYLLPDTTTKAVFNIPARLSLSYFSEINDKIDMMFDYTFIKSSVMDELSVGFGVEEDSNGNKVVLADAKIPLKWQDSYKVSLGLNYHFDDKTTFKTGFQYDKTPIPSKEFRHPALPESDRYMASLGFNHKINKKYQLMVHIVCWFLQTPNLSIEINADLISQRMMRPNALELVGLSGGI